MKRLSALSYRSRMELSFLYVSSGIGFIAAIVLDGDWKLLAAFAGGYVVSAFMRGVVQEHMEKEAGEKSMEESD